MGRIDYETETLVTHALRADGFDASEDGTGRGTPIVPVLGAFQNSGQGWWNDNPIAQTIRDASAGGASHANLIAFCNAGGDTALSTDEHTAPPLTTRHGDPGLIAFSCKDSGADSGEIAPTLRAMEFDGSHANGGGQVAVAFRAAGQDGFVPSEISPPVAHSDGGGSGVPTTAYALAIRGREGVSQIEVGEDIANAILTPNGGRAGIGVGAVLQDWAVRRLTPIETARLQGFLDSYAHIPRKPRKIDAEEAAHYLAHGIECWQDGGQWMTKAAADGPIYRAHGNSMATNVMKWLGRRIEGPD